MHENHITEGIDSLLTKNLEEMRKHFTTSLYEKAAETLEEKKQVIAQNLFTEK